MRDNWIKNSEGVYYNLDFFFCFTLYKSPEGTTIVPIGKNLLHYFLFEPKVFKTEEEAQHHLDLIMSGDIHYRCDGCKKYPELPKPTLTS